MAGDPSHEDSSGLMPEQASSGEVNPYAPPRLGDEPSAQLPTSDARVFSTAAVGVATFLGSALAGTILMYLSLSRLQRRADARRAALLGGALTLATLGLAVVLPQGIGNAVPIAVTLAMVMLARKMLDPVVVPHLERGGRKGSALLVAGVSIASALVVFGAGIGLSEGLDISADDYVESTPGHRVIYERGATEGEGSRVADVLETNGIFPPGGRAEVVLRRKGSGLELQVVLGSSWKEPSVIAAYTALAKQLSTRTGRSPLVILLCNEYLITKQTVSSEGP